MNDGNILEGVPGVDDAREKIEEILDWFSVSDIAVNWFMDIEGILKEYVYSQIEKSKDDKGSLGVDRVVLLSERISLIRPVLADAISRAFRRILYCKVFNGIDLNEMKLAGLFAYWIVKLHPIVVDDGTASNPGPFNNHYNNINERFAVHIVLSMFTKKYSPEFLNTSEYSDKLLHAIRYRSHTENTMMLLAESLGSEAF